MNKSRYAAGPEVYLEIVRDLSYEHVQMMIIGHNAGLEELIEMLTGEIDKPLIRCWLRTFRNDLPYVI